MILHDADGDRVGKVWLRQKGDYVHVWTNVHSLPPGFHGFHVHASGVCDPADPAGPFMSAGGHYNPIGLATATIQATCRRSTSPATGGPGWDS